MLRHWLPQFCRSDGPKAQSEDDLCTTCSGPHVKHVLLFYPT